MSAAAVLIAIIAPVLIVCGLVIIFTVDNEKSAKMAYFGAVVTLCGLVILAVTMAKLAGGG